MAIFEEIFIFIVAGVYEIAAYGFKLFFILAEGILIDSSKYESLINNIYVILGIVMLFVVAFMLLKMIVNPDDEKNGTSAIRKMILNLVTSSILLALLPTIFGFAYDFQTAIFDQGVIPNIFNYGDNSAQIKENDVKSEADKLVNGVFLAFFEVNIPWCEEKVDDFNASDEEKINACRSKINGNGYNLQTIISNVATANHSYYNYTAFGGAVAKKQIDFSFILSLVAGGLLCYLSLSFCLDMGLRLVKLVFFQIIAPIPIMLRIVPNGKLSGTFNEWMKITFTCYLEVFIRVFLIYFVLFLCKQITGNNSPLFDGWTGTFILKQYIKAFIFMGLITFMKQAPKLLSQMTGIDSGNMSLGIREKLAAGGAFTAGAIIGGGVTAGVRNATNAFQKNFEKDPTTGKWKRKSGVTSGDIAKSVFTGGLSTFAGGLSGAFRSGKAGWGAKSVGDMNNASTKGASDAVKARNIRAGKNARYKANGQNAFERNPIGGRIMDALQGMQDYASGGAEKYSTIIKTSDEITGAYDTMETQAKKIMEKFYNDGNIVKRPTSANDFKGPNAAELYQLYSKYGSNATLSLIQSDLQKMEGIDPASLLNKASYMRANGTFDQARYTQDLETARINHAKKVANTREMLTQLEKKSVEYIIQNAIVNGNAGTDWTADIKQSDLQGVLSAAKEFETLFKSDGNNVIDPITGNAYSKAIDLSANDVQEYMDGIQKAYKNIGNQARQESADMRRRAEQRKNE